MGQLRIVFVTDRAPIHRRLALEAAPEGIDVTMLATPSEADLTAGLAGVDVLVSERKGEVDAEVIGAGHDLKLIQRLGSQIHDIDLEAARQADIPVCTWPLPGCTMVAEHAVMQILTLAKRLRDGSEIVIEAGHWGDGPQRCDADTFKMNWSERDGIMSIHGSTIGIIGFGEIGTELATRLGPFGCRVLYNRRTRLPELAESRLGVEYAPIRQLTGESDVVCSLLPHSEVTEGLIDSDFIERMKPGAMLVSTGASTILDEEAVAEAYRSGRLGGVATDGFRWEPVRPDNPLVALALDRSANVVLTPHSAQGDRRLGAEARVTEWTNVAHLLAGRPLEHRVV